MNKYTTAPHTLTTDELLRYYPDNPLAAALQSAQEQLEQVGRALTAARSLQDIAAQAGDLLENSSDPVPEMLARLFEKLDELTQAATAFGEVDDGELGA
jgi:hypothetical protein